MFNIALIIIFLGLVVSGVLDVMTAKEIKEDKRRRFKGASWYGERAESIALVLLFILSNRTSHFNDHDLLFLYEAI